MVKRKSSNSGSKRGQAQVKAEKKKVPRKLVKKTATKRAKKTKVIINGKLSKKEALKKARKKLNKAAKEDIEAKSLEDFDDDMTLKELRELEKKGVRIIYPNLKYKKPKYKNIGDILKYTESDEGAGDGVRIVIMNFND